MLHSPFLLWAPSKAGSLPRYLVWARAGLLGVGCVASGTQRGLPGTVFLLCGVDCKIQQAVCLVWKGYSGMPLTGGPLKTSVRWQVPEAS